MTGESAAESPRVIFGCGGAWAATWFDEKQAALLLDVCAEIGISDFDTGPTYGGKGCAEVRLGAFLAANPSRNIRVSTKVGTHRDAGGKLFKDYSSTGLRSSLEASLRRLGTDSVDLVLIHGPVRPNGLTEELIDNVGQLRDAGLAHRIGASCDGPIADALVESGAFDVLMATYNFFDTDNLSSMAAAKKSGMSVVVKAPLAHGAAGFPRRPLLRRTNSWYNARLLARRPHLVAAAVRHRHQNLTPEALLEFVARQDVDGIVIGTTSEHHLRSNAATIVAAGPRSRS